ncbi:MAG TPA: hypothetical protein VK797_28955 [Tepidisphaeraceae bacterium]|jgi:hypothetical protein|nr:hypothetical protein [Tepidisphaeraceae bacterium]
MVAALKQLVTVKPGGVVEVRSDELKAGTTAEVIVLVESASEPARSLSSFIGSGKGCFTDVQEVDAFIRGERDAWDL